MTSTVYVAGEERRGPAPSGLTTTDLLLLCMALIWGVNFAVVKFGTQAFSPLAFNSARLVLAAIVLSAVVVLGRYPLPRGRDLRMLLSLGILGNGLYQILFVEGISRTRAGDAALLIAASPAFIAIIGWLRGTERTNARGVAGIALSLVGIALVVFGGGEFQAGSSSSLLGDALILMAALCWSLYSVLLKPYTERIDGVPLSAVTMIGGTIPMLVVSAPALAHMPWSSVGLPGWAAVAYSGLFALALAYFFWYRGVKVLGPTRTAMYANLQPLIALGVAWATLNEAPQLPQLTGAAFIMAGLILTRLGGSTITPPCE
jgi:drug/metabolite transporter (DMT)-like permease